MNKKQLKKIRRVKLLKKKHNKTKNTINKKLNQDIVKVMKRNLQTGEQEMLTMTKSQRDKMMFEQEMIGRELYNIAPTMIHEDDFIPHECFLCDKKIENIHDSHNPFPLIDFNSMAKEENGKDEPKRCCSECENSIIMPARFDSCAEETHKEVWAERNAKINFDSSRAS